MLYGYRRQPEREPAEGHALRRSSRALTTEAALKATPSCYRSPFRYPGGKTWLVPSVRRWLRERHGVLPHFVEPFAGGGVVSVVVACEGLAGRVTMVELDDDVAAVWKAILSPDGDAQWLRGEIKTFAMTQANVDAVLREGTGSVRATAFATLLRNRINRGGILAAGAGRLNSGERRRGLLSRWYPETICRRIAEIERVKDRIEFVHGDGIAVMHRTRRSPRCAYFIDPPYAASGRRLYRHNEVDHERIFSVAAGLRGDFLMTYDASDEIRALADRFDFQVSEVFMTTAHHSQKTELLIGRDLSWLRQ
jgi:DNA adenine methylase